MNRMRGFTLTELLIVMMIASMLTLGAFSGWQSWQQLQRLNDSARQIQHFLLRLRGKPMSIIARCCCGTARINCGALAAARPRTVPLNPAGCFRHPGRRLFCCR
uniref:prepilin-type N-terminal cleavage/methylation domain-containing protein n=1 Tax=unclassified Erwinia TaxID=2622719 RepID=UPI00403F3226